MGDLSVLATGDGTVPILGTDSLSRHGVTLDLSQQRLRSRWAAATIPLEV